MLCLHAQYVLQYTHIRAAGVYQSRISAMCGLLLRVPIATEEPVLREAHIKEHGLVIGS